MAKTNKTTQDYLREPYERVLIPEEDGGFSASISEFEGCYAYGETPDEALRNLEEVAVAWIESELSRRREIPPAWVTQEYSGRFALRMPKSLHQALVRLAEREGSSLNQYIVHLLSAGSGAAQEHDKVLERVLQGFSELKETVKEKQASTAAPSANVLRGSMADIDLRGVANTGELTIVGAVLASAGKTIMLRSGQGTSFYFDEGHSYEREETQVESRQ